MRLLATVVGSVSLCLMGCGASSPGAQGRGSILPLHTARLYETGIGYFERTGVVSGATSLPVPVGHIDDALKSLVVLSQGGKALLHGVEFESSVSEGMARALAGLPLQADQPITYFELLASLKGSHVQIATNDGHAVSGRVIDVLSRAPSSPAKESKESKGTDDDREKSRTCSAPDDEITVLVLTDAAEMRRVLTGQITSVRPTDPAVVSRYQSALTALASTGGRAERLLKILGESSAPVTLGYIAEAPLWRTTYRIVITPGAKGSTLQGWALLHNDTDEDWRGVNVELVNGRPDSFLFPLAAPRYARRELVTPENEASTVPQLLRKTADGLYGDRNGDDDSGMSLSGTGEGGGGYGMGGIGLGSVGTIGHGYGAGSGESQSSLLAVGDLASVVNATGKEGANLFTYSLAHPLDLRSHASALVPFLQRSITAEPITWLTSASATPRAGLRFENSTSQTLPAGPVAIFAEGGFAGETSLERLKPGERRFLEFGNDLDTEVSVETSSSKDHVKRVRMGANALESHFLRQSETTYAIRNRSGNLKKLYLATAMQRNASITGADEVDFDTKSERAVLLFKAPPGKPASRTIKATEGLSRITSLANITAEELTRLASESDLSPLERTSLENAAKKQRDVEASQKVLDASKKALAVAVADLQRLREDLKALGDKGAGANNPLVTRVIAAEDAHTRARVKMEAMEAEIAQRAAAVVSALEPLRE